MCEQRKLRLVLLGILYGLGIMLVVCALLMVVKYILFVGIVLMLIAAFKMDEELNDESG